MLLVTLALGGCADAGGGADEVEDEQLAVDAVDEVCCGWEGWGAVRVHRWNCAPQGGSELPDMLCDEPQAPAGDDLVVDEPPPQPDPEPVEDEEPPAYEGQSICCLFSSGSIYWVPPQACVQEGGQISTPEVCEIAAEPFCCVLPDDSAEVMSGGKCVAQAGAMGPVEVCAAPETPVCCLADGVAEATTLAACVVADGEAADPAQCAPPEIEADATAHEQGTAKNGPPAEDEEPLPAGDGPPPPVEEPPAPDEEPPPPEEEPPPPEEEPPPPDEEVWVCCTFPSGVTIYIPDELCTLQGGEAIESAACDG